MLIRKFFNLKLYKKYLFNLTEILNVYYDIGIIFKQLKYSFVRASWLQMIYIIS